MEKEIKELLSTLKEFLEASWKVMESFEEKVEELSREVGYLRFKVQKLEERSAPLRKIGCSETTFSSDRIERRMRLMKDEEYDWGDDYDDMSLGINRAKPAKPGPWY